MNEKLIVEYLRLVLNEDSLGSSIAQDEEAARLAYASAMQALDKWDIENRKKETFLAQCRTLGISPDTLKARALKTSEPDKYNYDPKVLQSSSHLLKAKVAKARKQLSMFDPSAIDFNDDELVKKAPHAKQSGVEVRMPERRKKVYIGVDKLEPLQLYRWDDKRWANAIRQVPIGFGKGKDTGHPGEERLALILGGEVQSDNVSFDIVTHNGWHWEVKGISKPSDKIRPGVQGQRAYQVAESALNDLCDELKDFVEEIDGDVNDITTSVEQRGMYAVCARFVEEEMNELKSGEISRERFILFRRALKAASSLKKAWRAEVGEKGPEMLNIVGKDVSLSREKYIDVARRVHSHSPEADVLSVIDARERALQLLWSKAFDDPDAWLNEWDASIDVSKIFAEVAGIFVVTHQGFYKIPRKMLRKALKLFSISQGLPRYIVDL